MNPNSPAPSFEEIRRILKDLTQQDQQAKREMQEIREIQKELSASQKARAEQASREIEEIRKIYKEIVKLTKEQKESDKVRAEEVKREFWKTEKLQRKTELEVQKIRGRFNQRWGHLVESLVEGNLVKIFQEQNIDISETYRRVTVEPSTRKGTTETREYDIIVANGTEVVVVEVKTSLTLRDVHDFLTNLQEFKRYMPRYKDMTLYGAVAYLTSESKSHSLAEREGLFVIRATGDSASLVNARNFKPKVFS